MIILRVICNIRSIYIHGNDAIYVYPTLNEKLPILKCSQEISVSGYGELRRLESGWAGRGGQGVGGGVRVGAEGKGEEDDDGTEKKRAQLHDDYIVKVRPNRLISENKCPCCYY